MTQKNEYHLKMTRVRLSILGEWASMFGGFMRDH